MLDNTEKGGEIDEAHGGCVTMPDKAQVGINKIVYATLHDGYVR